MNPSTSKNLKLNKISAAVAFALTMIAAESNAITLDNTSPYSSASTGIGSDITSNSYTIGSGVTPVGIYIGGGNASWPGGAGPLVDPSYNAVGTGLTDTNSGTISSATGTTTNSNYIINNTSTITVSGGNNTGIILRSANTQSHTAYASIYATSNSATTATAIAHSIANSSAWVNLNTIVNSGAITANTGIALISTSSATTYATANAYVSANNDNVSSSEYPYASLTASAYSSAQSFTRSNDITNSGTINATTIGINLNSNATGIRTTVINYDAWTAHSHTWSGGTFNWGGVPSNTYYTLVNSQVGGGTLGDGNNILNTGSIVVSNGAGIVLNATAQGNTSLGSTASYAWARVLGNTIANSGTIAAGYTSGTNISDGIGLYASTTGANVTGFTALVDSNTITNTRLVYAMNNGVNLTASSTYNNVNSASVTSNTINNNYIGWDDEVNTAQGRIVANNTGINVVATTVDGNTINNSGLIVSDPGMTLNGSTLTKSNANAFDNTNSHFVAININGAGTANTVNLNAPSYLAGTILLSNGTGVNSHTTVNLTSGYSHSNVWSIQNDGLGYGPAAVNLAGPLPWFVRGTATGVNGQDNLTYATLDPTALAARPNMIADLSDSAHSLIASNMTKDLSAKGRAWFTGQLGTNRYDPTESKPVMDQKTNLYTVAAGYDQTVADKYRVGVMIGYNRSELETGSLYSDIYANSYKNSSTGGFASVHGTTKVSFLDIDGGLSFGIDRHNDTRFVNDNLKWWGISYAKSKYNSQWVSPSLKLGIPFDLGSNWTVSPNAQVAYTYENIDSYTETGSNSNASYDSQGIGIVESKLAIDLSKSIGPVKGIITAGYLNRDVTSGDSVNVTMIGDHHDIQSYYQTLNAGYAKAGVRWDITDKLAFNLAGTYMKGSRGGTDGGNGNFSFQYKF